MVGRGVGCQARLGVDWMGSSRGGRGMSREGHGCRNPSPFSSPSISRGLITTARQAPNRATESNGVTHVREGILDGSMGAQVILCCVAAWECSTAQLRTILTW